MVGISCFVTAGTIEALPTSLNLRKWFLEILEAIDLAHSEEMQKEILADMKRDFSQDTYYWDWLARVKCNKLDIDVEIMRGQVNAALQVYEVVVSIVTSGVMYDLYVKFFMSVIAPKRTVGCLTKELANQHIFFYLEIGNTYDAREMLKKYIVGKFLVMDNEDLIGVESIDRSSRCHWTVVEFSQKSSHF